MDKKTILVVEDEQMVRELLVKVLGEHGYKTIEAENGKIAQEMWEKHLPDLVLLDILLPEMNGFELMKTMRNHPNKKYSDVPVIVLSNLWQTEDINRMKEYNVEEYMVKANNTTKDVLARIDQYFSQSK